MPSDRTALGQTRRPRRAFFARAAGILALTGGLAVAPATAQAGPCVDEYYRVEARELALRPWPGAQAYGWMYSGDIVLKDRNSPTGLWMRVYSFRNAQWGWAMTQYLRFSSSNPNGNCTYS